MIFLITGGAGFIGSALIRKLLKDKKNTIINVDNLSYSANLESIPNTTGIKNYFFEECDIRNFADISRIVEKYQPNIIFHLAAESHVDRSIINPKKFITTNIIGTYNLLEASKKIYKKNKSKAGFNFKFHHISTDEVFGDLSPDDEKFTELSTYQPSSPYAASKASSDHLVRSWGRTFDIPFIITNCSNNYGPYQFPEKLIPHIIINAINGNNLPIYGDGTQVRDWLFVDDHIDALLLVAKSKKINGTYLIGGNNELKNINVVKNICLYLNDKISERPNNISSFLELIEFVKDRPGHDMRYAIDPSKLMSEFSWKPKFDFEIGIKKTIDWYIDNSVWWNRILSGKYKLERIGIKTEQ